MVVHVCFNQQLIMTLLSLVFLVTLFAIESSYSLESFCLFAAPFTTGRNTPLRLNTLNTTLTPFVFLTRRIESEKTTTTAAARWLSKERVFFQKEKKQEKRLTTSFTVFLLFLHFLIERLAFSWFFHPPFTTLTLLPINKMPSDTDWEIDDIEYVVIPGVPLFDLVSQRLLLVSVPESEKNPDEFMRNAAIDEFDVEPSSLHLVEVEGTYFCFDESKIADGLFSTHNSDA